MNAKTRWLVRQYLIPILIASAFGAFIGYYGQCNSGTCPLTSTWWRGAIYGGGIGLFIAYTTRR